jgi:RNA polymerase sigma-70 factor (ECF subfamily)
VKKQANDAELVKRIVKGNESAFREFYERFFEKVYKYAYGKVKNREDAEDITEETFFKAFKGLGNFEEQFEGGLDIWMYSIERNVVRDYFRKRTGYSVLPFEEQWNAILNPPIDDPYVTAEKSEIEKIISESLQELPEQYREVINLRFFKNMSLKEIATLMKRNVGAVKVLQFRAMRKLRAIIKEKMGNE